MAKKSFYDKLKIKAVKMTDKYSEYENFEDTYDESDEYYEDEYYEDDYESDEYYDEYEDDEYSEEDYSEEDYSEDEYSEDEYYEDEYYEDEEYNDEDSNDDDLNDEDEEYDEEYSEYDEYVDEEYQDDDEAYSTATEAYFEESDYAEDSIDYYEREEIKKKSKIKEFVGGLTVLDVIVSFTGVAILIIAIFIFSLFMDNKSINNKIEAIVPVGNQLKEIGVIGNSGLLAMADSALAAQQALDTQEIEAEILPESNVKKEEKIKVNVTFESIERDLYIRFTNLETGEYITGTAFEVRLTNAKGKELVLTDSDMDGYISATNVNPGDFSAIITSTDKFKFPKTPTKVTVKNKVQYVVLNIKDEVKKENQVDAKKEDTEKVEAKEEEVVLKDTVEFVASSKTLIPGSDGYIKVEKDVISDPSKTAKLLSSRMLLDALKVELNKKETTIYTDNSETLSGTKYENSKDDENEYTYTFEWKSSNEEVAKVDGEGKVTAVRPGTADITYTVTKKTVTKKKVEKETKEPKTEEPSEEMTVEISIEEKEISVEEYENLSDKEKEKCSEIKNDDDQITGYIYKKEVEKEVPKKTNKEEQKTEEPKKETKEEITETTESQSATCKVTVEDIKITDAKLEIKPASDVFTTKTTLEIKPVKLEYTKSDGTKETITEKFPEFEWSSSDEKVATVDKKTGVVTGVKSGEVTITARLKGIIGKDGKELDIKSEVKLKVVDGLNVKFESEEVTVAVGKTVVNKVVVSNFKQDSSVTWKSEDVKIAIVDENGTIKGAGIGTVMITATTKETDPVTGKPITATCIVKVTSSATTDTKTKLVDRDGKQIYVKDANGEYKEAVYADYFTAEEFFRKGEGKYTYTGWQTINGKTYFYTKDGNVVTGSQVIQGVTYNFGLDGAILTNFNGSTFGIDVSKHNGKIDWNAVKASGVDFVIIRCAYRGSSSGALIEDPNFHTNIKGATNAGLKVGIYLFSQAINEVEAVKEASLAVSLAKGYNLTYPIFIDTEASGGRADSLDKNTRTAVVNAFCQTVQNAGYRAGIYASKTWYEKKLNMSSLNGYKIWLAQYAASPSLNGKFDMWQYSCKGKINGIEGNVDLNYSYMGY